MRRWFVTLLALAACKGPDLGPVHDGISRVTVRTRSGDGYSIEVGFVVRLQQPRRADPDEDFFTIRAACQVGSDRIVDLDPEKVLLKPGVGFEVEASPFLIHPLPAEPSLCDLEVLDGDKTPIGRVCWSGGKVTEAACPPNGIAHAGVGPTGVTGIVSSVTPEDASGGWPAHLTIRYRATAHTDMPRGAYLVRMTTCPGRRPDDTWHDELGYLRGGESITAGMNTYKLGRPAAGAACETELAYAASLHAETTVFATFCHRDTAVTPGPCPR
jgi:hypothetical protein